MSVARPILDRLKKGESLREGEMKSFMTHLMDGRLSSDEIVEFLLALRDKGETVSDIIEAACIMRERCVKVPTHRTDLLDTCGTGGDGLKSINASTLTALVASAAGVPIAKHGNRSISGVVGSADTLEGLGVRIDLTPQEVASSIEKAGFGFIFAPLFHPAMKFAADARKRIKGRTIFNCLGPLTNPAGASRQLLGVYQVSLVEAIAQALARLGSKHVIVVHGENGLDEVSLSGTTHIAEWDNGKLVRSTVKPEDFGLQSVPVSELVCETGEEAISRATSVLNGRPGPATDFVLLNSGFALKAADRCPTVEQGIALGRKLLNQGAVMRKLEQIKEVTGKRP